MEAQSNAQSANLPNAARLRAAYIEAMGRFSDQHYANEYRNLLNQNEPPEVRIAGFHALGELHEKRWAVQMARSLQVELSPEVRAEAL